MSKGRPRAAARQAPSPLPAIRPRSRARPQARVLWPARPAAPLVPRAPRGLHFLLPCLLAPSPITHVSTFSRHHATPRPALFPPSPWVSSHRLSRQDFFPPDGSTPPLPRHLSRISNLLGLKMQTHRMLFTRLSEIGWVLLHHPETVRLFIRSCFQEGVGCPPLFLPRRLQASCFSILNKFRLRTRSFCPLYADPTARSHQALHLCCRQTGPADAPSLLPDGALVWLLGLHLSPVVDGACT